MMAKVTALCVTPDATISDAMSVIDNTGRGIVLIADGERRLLATITDGDIRRAILAGINLTDSVQSLVDRKSASHSPKPHTAPMGTDYADLLKLMQEHTIRQLPLLDEAGRVVDLITLDDLMPREMLPIQAVIMAGGFGKRLHPLTEDVPKPMLPVGDRPMMEHIVDQMREAGIRRVNVSTHHLAEKITEHFGDGSEFGVDISYVSEDRPLGTAGALRLMEGAEGPLLVVNGDVLTRVDYRSMLDFHRRHGADMTVAVRQYDLQVPYGVVECEGERVHRITEKPLLNFLVNAGIYLIEPQATAHIPESTRFDMTDLIERLIEVGRRVISFPVVEYWLDIGRHTDYTQAKEDQSTGRLGT
jgi:dTDP-glucose pyrophosphorylase/CBS domain-containing protein